MIAIVLGIEEKIITRAIVIALKKTKKKRRQKTMFKKLHSQNNFCAYPCAQSKSSALTIKSSIHTTNCAPHVDF